MFIKFDMWHLTSVTTVTNHPQEQGQRECKFVHNFYVESFCKYKFNPESNEDEINTTLMNSLNSTRQINNLSLNELNSLTLVQFDKINEIVRFCLNSIL